MKHIDSFLESRGSPVVVSERIINQLAKIGFESLTLSDFPIRFSRSHQSMLGYYAVGDSKLVRFEFTPARKLASVSVWYQGDALSGAPEYTVNVKAEASDAEIADALATGRLDESAEVVGSDLLHEASADDVKQFLKEIGYRDGGFEGSISKLYQTYLKWADSKGVKAVSSPTFYKHIRDMGKPAAISSLTISSGVADDIDAGLPSDYDDFEQEILNNKVLYKYEMMDEIVKRIVTWDPLYRNAFIYGSGGIGKTFSVTKVVDEFADKSQIVVKKGAISGFTGLLQILWQYRTKKIIILDDNDAVLGIDTALNLLKGALENSDPRIISYTRFKRGGPAKKESGLIIDVSKLHENLVVAYLGGELIAEETVTQEQRRWYEKVSGFKADQHFLRESEFEDDDAEMDEDWSDLDSDVDPAYGMSSEDPVPDEFQFTSRVIFISNVSIVPQPLLDRTITIGILLTRDQILDLIESKLEKIMAADAPQVSLDTKKDVLAFMRKYVHRIEKPLTFRLFMQLCSIAHTKHPNYQKMMYMAFMAEGMKTKLR